MTAAEYLQHDGELCSCGKRHFALLKKAIVCKGAVRQTGEAVRSLTDKEKIKAFVMADKNTFAAAGQQVLDSLHASGIDTVLYVYPSSERVEPTEAVTGSYAMHYDNTCDVIVAVGTGVINDNGKILAGIAHCPYVIVGTAPSMDGYASGTSSMVRDGGKISLNSKCPDVVIGDLDILSQAPMRMIQAGVGDMLAKYIGIAEWKIASLVNGEYFCPRVAAMVEDALHLCEKEAPGIVRREPEAVAAVMEGMILSGMSANYAESTRPVSGVEHYFSHLWDMRAIAFNAPFDLHGIQAGVGTVLTLRAYEQLKYIKPDREKALKYAAAFSFEDWKKELRDLLGPCAESLIELEYTEKKYDVELHAARLERILNHWDEIQAIAAALPTAAECADFLRSVGAPAEPEEIGIPHDIARRCFPAAKDVRDKYVLPRLLWDLGELEGVTEKVFG